MGKLSPNLEHCTFLSRKVIESFERSRKELKGNSAATRKKERNKRKKGEGEENEGGKKTKKKRGKRGEQRRGTRERR